MIQRRPGPGAAASRTSAPRSTRASSLDPPSGKRRARAELDAADARILELLAGNGRMSNRAVAGAVGLTEATVAARIRNLTERNVLGIRAVLDWQRAGYEWDAWLEVAVDGRSVRLVAQELASLPGVHWVQIVFGQVDLLVHVLVANTEAAIDVLYGTVKAVPGVRRVRPNVTLQTLKYTVRHARLPVRPSPMHCPAPVIDLDELDHAIIDALVRDGRQSNREAARNLGISEGAVRVRLRRLQDSGLFNIVGQCDPYLAGEVAAWAVIGIVVEGDGACRMAERLAAMPESTIVALTAGRHDLMVMLATTTRKRLIEVVVEDIRSLPGVGATETWEVVQTVSFNQQWARLV